MRALSALSVVAALLLPPCALLAQATGTSATTATLPTSFTRPPDAQPIIRPVPAATFTDPITHQLVHWEALHTFNPAAIVRNSKVIVLYRAEDNSGEMGIGLHTSRLGMAESSDGLHFTQRSEPVFYPAPDAQKSREWPGGVEDPRIVEAPDGTYVLTYTQWNRTTYSVGIATSPDLIHWTKYGPAFGTTGKYGTLKYKSAGILTEFSPSATGDGRPIAARLHGKYWMYWGEGAVSLATSNDLIHWTPVETSAGEPVTLLAPRAGKFDSGLPEVGPPPVLVGDTITLFYNGKNAAADNPDRKGDAKLPPGAYSVGLARFSAQDPTHLLERSSLPIFSPELPWEKSGQYAAGTTFAEGLVHFHKQWLLYYGCADSLVGVALGEAPQ